MPDPNEERLKYLFNATAIEVPKAEEGQKRKFKGTAYAGGRVDGHWYWGRSGVVFDLDGIEIDKPAALLEEHFSSSRIGVVQAVDTNGKIDVSGDFLTNEKAREIVQDSDDGLPNVPSNLKRMAWDIARYRLYFEKPTDEVRQRYEDAIAFLKRVADNKAHLQIQLPETNEIVDDQPKNKPSTTVLLMPGTVMM